MLIRTKIDLGDVSIESNAAIYPSARNGSFGVFLPPIMTACRAALGTKEPDSVPKFLLWESPVVGQS